MAETEGPEYTAEQIAAFKDAVTHVVPTALPADLRTLADYEIGRVLVYVEKPKAYISWRKTRVDFARGASGETFKLFDLLSEEDGKYVSENRLKTTETHHTSRCGEEFVYQFDPEDHSTDKLRVDFGSVAAIASNLYSQVNSARPRVDADHPAVKVAVQNGGVLMVVSTVYQSERASIELGRFAEDEKAPQWSPVYSSPKPTNIAYLVLKLKIDEDGVLSPMLKMGLTPSSLDKVNVDIVKRMTSITATGTQGDEEALTTGVATSPRPVVEEFQVVRMDVLEAAPGPVVEEVVAVQSDILEAAAPMGMGDVDYGGEHNHFQCGSRDFQVFHSGSYQGVINESSEFVKALVENTTLQEEFLRLVVAPHQRGNLEKLVKYLLSVQEAMQLAKDPVGACPKEAKAVVDKLTHTHPAREEEIKALLISAEAFKEFSGSTMKAIVELTPAQRLEVFGLIQSVPFGSTRHVLVHDAFPDSDPVYHLILRKIGFVNSSGHLGFNVKDDTLELLGAGITAVAASRKP